MAKMDLNILKKDSVLIAIGSTLMLLDFDDIGIIFIIIVLIKSFIKSEEKGKFVLEILVCLVGFVVLMFMLNRIEIGGFIR
ncbi:MAG: hypothetical protein N4A40_12380 [Tissierellales bacterium]|jgi:hypothetical protein|nr:hypothetical protein [Tissierellales bacterium]